MSGTNTQELTARIKTEAHRLGFDLVGVTGPSPPPHIDVYRHWLSSGRHGAMAYLASDRALQRRADPRLILPECKSILVVATNYLTQPLPPPMEQIGARVAAYALGDDYHDVLSKRLEHLAAFIEVQVNQSVPNRIYTDTGPILERELAQRAGLGWIGKNTCLINPQIGSYCILGELLLGTQLEPDPPFSSDRCGSCTRCIDACPTACLLPDRTLDARRCISYLTIEEKGNIPTKLRSLIGSWLFGCDICQQVCPWNARFATTTSDPYFQPRSLLMQPNVERFLSLTPGSWSQSLRNSPLLRPKRRGLVRNASIVAGNIGDATTVPSLARNLLSDPEPIVRVSSAWALGQIGGERAFKTLEQAKRMEIDPIVIDEIEAALANPPLGL
jgi:epoxyqueuosine reductase